MTESKPRACECGLSRYREGQSEVSTGCNRQVSGSRRRADGRTFGPTTAAEQYGFGDQVSAGIAKGRAKA